jgi:hypothetical protein
VSRSARFQRLIVINYGRNSLVIAHFWSSDASLHEVGTKLALLTSLTISERIEPLLWFFSSSEPEKL